MFGVSTLVCEWMSDMSGLQKCCSESRGTISERYFFLVTLAVVRGKVADGATLGPCSIPGETGHLSYVNLRIVDI